MTSMKVCAFGACRLSSIAMVAKSRIWTVAPLAYLKEIAQQKTTSHSAKAVLPKRATNEALSVAQQT